MTLATSLPFPPSAPPPARGPAGPVPPSRPVGDPAPGFAAPVPVGGRLYLDGAFGGGANAGLAAGAGTVVLVEPLPQMSDGAGADVRIVPDERSLEVFGGNVGDISRWTPAHREGRRQAPAAARLIGGALSAAGDPLPG